MVCQGEGECRAEPVSAKENCFDLMFCIVQLFGGKNKHCQMGAAKFHNLSRVSGCSVIFFSSEYSSFWSLVIYTRLFIFIFITCCRKKKPQNMEPRGSSVSELGKHSAALYFTSRGV